jgi:hypothetical protein
MEEQTPFFYVPWALDRILTPVFALVVHMLES